MNFFEHQDAARKNTSLLVVLFATTLLALIALIYIICIFTVSPGPSWQPGLAAMVIVAVLGIVLGATLIKSLELCGGGGSAVAETLGGVAIHPYTSDLSERRLTNVVEEMAIASGIAAPPVYVMPEESGINAFAAGWSPDEAVIAVTRGALNSLTRDELQGVVAHEFSHILNGDMRLNTRLIGVLHGIMVIGTLGYYIMRAGFRRGGDRRANVAVLGLLGVGVYAVGSLGVLCGKLIRASVSRQREFLADASAVQFTRNPYGIGGALLKIGGFPLGSELLNPSAEEASHMFFSSALDGMWARLLATHPPIEERVRRIDPSWQGQLPKDISADVAAYPSQTAAVSQMTSSLTSPQDEGLSSASLQGAFDTIGAPSEAHLQHAQALLLAIPPSLREAAREPFSARAVIFALLLSHDEAIRGQQLDSLSQHEEGPMVWRVRELYANVDLLDTRCRLPLLDITLPALHELSAIQFHAFETQIKQLIEADGRMELFEWTLAIVVQQHLAPHFRTPKLREPRHRTLKPVAGACGLLLSAIARTGQRIEDDMRFAFGKGVVACGLAGLALASADDCDFKRLEEALAKLQAVAPSARLTFLQSCLVCATADNRVTIREAELIRAIADSLQCPIPPLLPS